MRIALWSLVLSVLTCSQVTSQIQSDRDSLPTMVPVTAADSARIVRQLTGFKVPSSDSVSTQQRGSKSPGLALLFSAVLPGAGQFYNESYWKIPILLGFGYYLASQWIDNNDSTKYYRNLFAASITPQNPSGTSLYQELREFYKDQRDTFSWYIFIYYLVNLVDAYVDASLYDFNVGDDLSIHVRPEFETSLGSSARLKVTLSF